MEEVVSNKSYGLPSNFKDKFDILSNYSKTPIRIQPSTGQSAIKSNGYINFQLPVGSVLDLRTFSWHFGCYTSGVTNATVVGLPKWTPALIKTLDILVNGKSIQHINYYSHLYNLLQDYKTGYNESIKEVGKNGDPSVKSYMTASGDLRKYNTFKFAPTATDGTGALNSFKDNYVINDWLGFLGSSSPSILNTNILGTIEIQIQVESGAVLWQQGTAVTPEFTIENSIAYIDKIEFKDERYYKIQEQILEGGKIQIPFKNYTAYPGTDLTNTKTTTLKFTENTKSLDKIIFTYLEGTRLTPNVLQLGTPANVLTTTAFDVGATITQAGINATLAPVLTTISSGYIAPSMYNYTNLLANGDPNVLNNSIYFKRNGLGLGAPLGSYTTGSVQFEINSQDMTPPLTLPMMYDETMKAFELNDDAQKSINPSLNDICKYERDFFACAFSTSHINDKSSIHYISGRNTQATSMNISIKAITGRANDNAQAGTPIAFTEMTSILVVQSGRNVSLIR
jgi:hypothetical protein